MEVSPAVRFPGLFGRSTLPSPSGAPAMARPGDGGEGGVIDEAEFVTLLGLARGKLWVIAAAVLSDRAEADDVVQEASLVGLAKRSSFQRGSSFEGWMGQITRNLALNASRRRHRRFVRTDARQLSAAAGGSTTPTMLSAEMETALGALEPVARECLLFRVVGGLSYEAISQILGIPEGTAMSHVHRSRQRMRQRLASTLDQIAAGGDGANQ